MSGLYISAASKHPQVCWEWFTFLSARGDTVAPTDFPARRSVAQAADVLTAMPPGAAAVYDAYLPQLERAPSGGTPSVFDNPNVDLFWLLQALDRAIKGKNLEQELRTAEDVTRQHSACVQAKELPSRCARHIDPQYTGQSWP